MMRRCCCCVGLRSGSVLVALLFLLLDTAALLWAALGLAGQIQAWPAGMWYAFSGRTLRAVLYAGLAAAAVGVACDVTLLAAVVRQRRPGLLCWLLWTALRLTLLTLALLLLLVLALWMHVDRSAAVKLGWRRRAWHQLMSEVPLTEQQLQWARQHEFLVLAAVAACGLLVTSVLWLWYSAVSAYSRRLRHASVIVHRSRTHTSHL